MTTTMHRLQISLPREQLEYLNGRAQREGISIAEVVRRLVEREARATTIKVTDVAAALSVIGIGESREPLVDGIPVSQQPDLYLYGPPKTSRRVPASRSKSRRYAARRKPQARA